MRHERTRCVNDPTWRCVMTPGRLVVFLLLASPLTRGQVQTGFKRKIADISGIKQGCETTGYEERTREICEEVTDRICTPIKVVKYRPEIFTSCDTRIRQDCNTTVREVPKEVCEERLTLRCYEIIKLEEATKFTKECENIVQHICEEHYKVPPKKKYPPPPEYHHHPIVPYTPRPGHPPPYPPPPPPHHTGYPPDPHHHPAKPPHHQVTPIPHFHVTPHPADVYSQTHTYPKKINLPPHPSYPPNYQSHSYPNTVLPRSAPTSPVPTIHNTEEPLYRSTTLGPSLHHESTKPPPHKTTNSRESIGPQRKPTTPQPIFLSTPTTVISSLPRLSRRRRQTLGHPLPSHPAVPGQPGLIPPDHLIHQLKTALKVPGPPEVSHQEIPAPEGCRSVVTQKCHKVPERYTKKTPEDVCREVPDVECHLELEKVEEPNCYNTPVEECEDEYKEVPFLVDDEECEDVPRLDCTEVKEEIPIQVCTSIDINRPPIITSLGDDIDLGADEEERRGRRQGKSLDFDDYSEDGDEGDEETLDTLRRLLRPSDLSRLRERVFGEEKDKEKPRRPRKRKKNKHRPKKDIVSRRDKSSIGSKELKEGIRTILKAGELEEILRTGTFDWNAKRIKRYEAIEPDEEEVESESEYEFEYEYEYEEEDNGEKVLEGLVAKIKTFEATVKNPTKEEKEEEEEKEKSPNRRKQILNLVEQLLSMKSDD